jgi:hypothetical protein
MAAGWSGSVPGLTRATSMAEPATTPAITAKTAPEPYSPSRSAATAGPTRTLMLSVQPEATFAAVSSSGVRARVGSRAPWAGRVMVTEVAASAARP